MIHTPLLASSVLAFALLLTGCGHVNTNTSTTAEHVILAMPIPGGRIDEAYQETVPNTDGPGNAWLVVGGELPPGIVLNGSSPAILAGSPTRAGTFDFELARQGAPISTAQSYQVTVGSCTSLAGGWTDLAPQPGARVIYVSSSGNDSNSGTETSPRQTLAGGYALLRNGQADWLLLNRGDTFLLTNSFQWAKSGPASGPGWMRLGAYGDENLPRPVLLSQGGGRIVVSPGYQSANTIRRLAITDVFLWAQDRLATAATTTANLNAIQLVAVQWQGSGRPFAEILVENCRISGFTFGFVCSNDVSDLSIRRCIFDHIFCANGTHSTAIIGGPSTWLLEDNIFYQVMAPGMPGVIAPYSGYAHAVYVTSEATDVTSRGNISVKTPDGIMQRAGGVFQRNVSLHTNIAANVGQTWGVTPTPGGVLALVDENLAVNTIGGSFFLGNVATGRVSSNLLLQDADGQGQTTMTLVARNSSGSGVNIGVHDTTFTSNLVSGTISWNPTNTTSYSNLRFTDNHLNLGPTSTSISAYLRSIGWPGSNVDDWAEHLLQRDRANLTARFLSTSVINFYRQHYCLPQLR